MNRITTKPSSLRTPVLFRWMTLAITLVGLTACGGGGGNGGTGVAGGTSGGSGSSSGSTAVPGVNPPLSPGAPTFVAGVFQPSAVFANQCARPRTGTDPSTGQPFPDQPGSVLLENNFLRSRANETYLWYRDIQDQNPALFTDPLVYFDTLKTMAVTPSGVPQDQFHFTIPTAEFDAFSSAGVQADYGFKLTFETTLFEIVARITLIEPTAPNAVTTLLSRGDRLLSIDGISVSTPSSQAEVDSLNAALSPQNGETHTFVFGKRGSGAQQSVTLTATNIVSTPVQKVQLIPGTTVGYMLFNDHIATAEGGLINAITTLKNSGATELVLDIRYNGGGFLDIANELAFMIAGPGPTAGRTFERLVFNDKNPSTNPVTGEPLAPTPFATRALGFDSSVTPGTPLPSLNLPRVFVLTTSDTCSASESIINSLRGVDVDVVQIGSTTCGKPFGFFPEPNCGTTYFSIQFQGVNDKNFGAYSDGFTPANTSAPRGVLIDGCAVADDFSRDLGEPSEALLSAALGFITANGACPLPSPSVLAVNKAQLRSPSPSIRQTGMFRSPQLENRWLR